jgi:hypothetical protein
MINKQGGADFDQTFHFPVTIPRMRRHPFNLVRVAVWGFDQSNDGNEPNSLGQIDLHLHEIMTVRRSFGIHYAFLL